MVKKLELKEIPIEKVKGNPLQPREYFDREKIKQLAETIKKIGLINPITVRKAKNDSYEIVTGERRLKASEIAKLKTIPSLVKEYKTEEDIAIESLIENVHREGLNPMEQAKFIKRIWEMMGKPEQKEVSRRLGLSHQPVGEAFRLLGMPTEVKKAVQKGKLAMRSASIISQLPKEKQIKIAKEAIRREEGERIGRSEVKQILEEEKPEPMTFERTARDVTEELYDWFSSGTHLINELAKDMNLEDLEQDDKNQLITSTGVLIFNTFPKLTKALIKAGAKPDKKILELMEKIKKK